MWEDDGKQDAHVCSTCDPWPYFQRTTERPKWELEDYSNDEHKPLSVGVLLLIAGVIAFVVLAGLIALAVAH